MHRTPPKTYLLAGALALMATSTQAVLLIDAGTHTIAGGSVATQYIDLYVQNTGAPVRVGAFDLYIQLDSGGGTSPAIVSGDLLTGTIFQSNNSGSPSDITFPQSAYFGVAKANGAVGSGPEIPSGSSKFARIGISTVDVTSGSWEIHVDTTILGDTGYFADTAFADRIPIEFINGTLNLGAVPEPSQMAIAAGLGLLGFGVWRRARRA